MLVTLGKDEVLDVLNKEGEVAVTCEFCNQHYRFDGIDVEQAFADLPVGEPSVSEH
jgi:molecular chaperone Hsp33